MKSETENSLVMPVPDSNIEGIKERTDPRLEPAVMSRVEHLFRYRYASRRCGQTVLDVGCGVGYGSRMVFETGRRVVGVDVSMDALRYATVRYPGPGYVRASGECLPFPARSFDSVIAFEVIEHLDRHEGLLDELDRVLKPGGDLFISTPNPRHLWNALRHWLRGAPYPEKLTSENIYHRREYHYEEFIQILKDREFSIRSTFGQTILLRPLNPVFARLRLFKFQVYSGYFIPKYAVTVVVHAAKSS
ncbi:MAG: class I SAM-dependent methyltransferase [Candidatus Latescibacteria bacterium]|nr:class I SAM-dependent methyltransferase [Candidatus Latescibacterota bacterium]